MCFSATASFVTAGTTGVIGMIAVTRVSRPKELLLAATPLLFAVQQSVEGLLWLNLPVAPAGHVSTALTLLFLLIAEVFWPVYASTAVVLVEPSQGRRRVMLFCLAVGVVVAAFLLRSILTNPRGAVVLDGHIVYVTAYRYFDAIGLAYLTATGLPLLLSSHRIIVVLGGIILVGSATAYALYWEAFVSVWCFFAAAASGVILFHFERVRRRRHQVARA